MSRKVLVICHNYEPEHIPPKPDEEKRFYTYGFGGNFGKNIKKYISEYEVEVWRLDGYAGGYYEDIVNLVKYRVFPSFHISNVADISLKFLFELKKEVKKNNPILIVPHTHYMISYMVALLFKRSKIITTHHGEWSPFYRVNKTSGLRKLKSFFDIMLEKISFKNIDCILTSELNQIPYFQKAYKNITYILWSTGVNFEYMNPVPKEQARRELGWDLNKKYILYVGKLYEYKQADVMIKTWLDIKNGRPEIELVVIGNTPGDPWEKHYQLAVDSGVMVLGRILNKELYKYYSAADVYVLFALRDDYFGGTGVAALESLACNTPVVSYALRNYIGDNINELGEVPDSAEKYKEALLKVIDNPRNYKMMRDSMFENYSYQAVYGRLKNLLQDLSEQ
ncbi:MAG: glycosyltransferase family 4 protein [Chlorobi bacterium]|nr:glycosyltransferase family 4 protein [Chlorobiota bacterium]MCI0716083.1 glycosyltransferase family 4 protein [Chlorobiota bacterium]